MHFKTILFATDFSDGSDFAFQSALAIAHKFDSKLIVVHIINEPVDLRGFYVPHISFDKLEEEAGELKAAVAANHAEQISDELGDLLFVAMNIARHTKIDA